MALTLETAISELCKAVPSFPVDKEWEADALTYLVYNDFARFICSEAEVLQYVRSDEEAHLLSKVPMSMQFLEHALEQGDSEVHDMVLDCIGTLRECQWEQQIKKWAGTQVLSNWKCLP